MVLYKKKITKNAMILIKIIEMVVENNVKKSKQIDYLCFHVFVFLRDVEIG